MFTVGIDKSGRVVVVNHKGETAFEAPEGVQLLADPRNPFGPRPVNPRTESVVAAEALNSSAALSHPVVSTLMSPSMEEYRSELGWHLPAAPGTPLTAALFLRLEPSHLRGYHFLLGGPQSPISFPATAFLGLVPNLADEDSVSLEFDPCCITFTKASSVSVWKPISEAFLGTLSTTSGVSFTGPPFVYTRFKLSADRASQAPGRPGSLTLECLILDGALSSLPPGVDKALASPGAKTICLWQGEVAWQDPNAELVLQTTPGIQRLQTLPSGEAVRWAVDFALVDGRQGGVLTSLQEYRTYIAAPYLQNPPSFPPALSSPSPPTPPSLRKVMRFVTYESFTDQKQAAFLPFLLESMARKCLCKN